MSVVPQRLVLASTSSYRGELLRRIVADFETCAAAVDEALHSEETPLLGAVRLAREKALAGARQHPGCLVIGSDQLADLDGTPLGKPGSMECAQAQLQQCSGRTVAFHTAVCVVDCAGDSPVFRETVDTTRVVFRVLDAAEISRYLAIERPLDCAGSFKVERLGVALFERVESNDPTALIGLPLIALSRLLRESGMSIP